MFANRLVLFVTHTPKWGRIRSVLPPHPPSVKSASPPLECHVVFTWKLSGFQMSRHPLSSDTLWRPSLLLITSWFFPPLCLLCLIVEIMLDSVCLKSRIKLDLHRPVDSTCSQSGKPKSPLVQTFFIFCYPPGTWNQQFYFVFVPVFVCRIWQLMKFILLYQMCPCVWE